MFVKVSRQDKRKMYAEAGYRERRIMDNARCFTEWNGSSRFVKVHNKKKNGGTNDIAIFDRKSGHWIN